MENLIVEVSKYLMIILFACYAYECFSAFRSRISTEKRNHIFDRQIFLMYLIHLDAFLVLLPTLQGLYFFQFLLLADRRLQETINVPLSTPFPLISARLHRTTNRLLTQTDAPFHLVFLKKWKKNNSYRFHLPLQ